MEFSQATFAKCEKEIVPTPAAFVDGIALIEKLLTNYT